jgi:hypothetical protein
MQISLIFIKAFCSAVQPLLPVLLARGFFPRLLNTRVWPVKKKKKANRMKGGGAPFFSARESLFFAARLLVESSCIDTHSSRTQGKERDNEEGTERRRLVHVPIGGGEGKENPSKPKQHYNKRARWRRRMKGKLPASSSRSCPRSTASAPRRSPFPESSLDTACPRSSTTSST